MPGHRQTTGQILLEFAKLGALVVLDLIRPSRPENRLPRRWLPRQRWQRRTT